MNIGKFNLNEDSSPLSGRRAKVYDKKGKKDNFTDDLPRLILLFLMLFAFIIGVIVHTYINQPHRLINSSVKKTLDLPFQSSIEGSTVIRNSLLKTYRARYRYTPEKGIETVSNEKKGSFAESSQEAPLNPLNALEALKFPRSVIELSSEDMYGYGTQHFSGLLSLPDKGGLVEYTFEYWIDTRTLLAVRLIVRIVEKNAGIDSKGISVSKETYLNIRYYNWKSNHEASGNITPDDVYLGEREVTFEKRKAL